MKVVTVSFCYNEKFSNEYELLAQHYTTTGWAEALQRKGIEAIVANRFYRNSYVVENNVRHLFYKDRLKAVLKSWQIPFSFIKRIRELNADVVHLHQLTLSPQVLFLRIMLPGKTAIIIQHHGGRPPRRLKRKVHNFFNQAADAFFFTTGEQGNEWFMKKSYKKILPVMEGATFFNYTNRNTESTINYCERNNAREKTGITGSPVFLWVGRLDGNKDPLTVLNGFKTVFKKYPGASLWMIYSDDKLIDKVKETILSSDELKEKVHLAGKINHDEIKMYYNSADYFVAGSHYEGSGYALSEALRCGCIPVVTDIPSFRMMTDKGRLGSLWQAGDKGSFIEAIDTALQKPKEDEIKKCILFFETTLSFDAIAHTAISHYQNVNEKRLGKKSGKVPAGSYAQ
jgi:glycosyltransferase involved in cell wall biosynthesis